MRWASSSRGGLRNEFSLAAFTRPASYSAAVVNRAPKKGHRVHALRSCPFFFFLHSLHLSFSLPGCFLPSLHFCCFVQPCLCSFRRSVIVQLSHFTSNVACFQPPTHTEFNEEEKKFAGFYLSNFWHFFASGLRVFFLVLRLSTCVVDPDHYTSP